MASMLPLPGDEKPVLAEVHQPQIAEDVFRRGDLKGTGDGMVALAQGLAAYGSAQTNREISQIKTQASIGEAVMGGLAQMAGKLKQNMKESGGEENIAYQFNPDSGQMTAVGPGQPFSNAGSIFSGGATGEDFLGGFFGNLGSGNPAAPTTQEEGQAPVTGADAAAGKGVSGPGTVAQATVVAGPAMHRNNMENDIWSIAQRNIENGGDPKNYLKETNEYLAKQYELSTSLGKGGKLAWEHAANFAGQTYRSVAEHYTKNKIKGDYNNSLQRMDRLENDVYSVSRTYDDSKVPFDKWFSEDPRWKEMNDIVHGISSNPATNSDFGPEKAAAFVERVRDRAKQEYVIGHAAGLRDSKGYDAAYDWVRKNTIDDPGSSLTPEQKQAAYHSAVNEINALNDQQKAQRSAAIHSTNEILTQLRQGGFRVVPQSEILRMASVARKAYAPEAALALESFARLNNSKEVQSAFRLNHVKAFESLIGPGGNEVFQTTIRANESNSIHQTGALPHGPQEPNRYENFEAAKSEKNLSAQEQYLYNYHLNNQWSEGGVNNPDGSRSTVRNTIIKDGRKYYNVPTVWDGKEHDDTKEITDHAKQLGLDNFPSGSDPKKLDERYLKDIHPYFEKDNQSYQTYRQAHTQFHSPQTQGAYKPGSIPMSGSAAQYGEHYVFGNMQPEFRDRLAAMAAAAKAEGVPFSVHSGFRSQEHQDHLFAHSDGSGHMVAKHSHHTAGDAADLSGDLGWAHRNAARFGLHFPMSWENWHIEMQGSRDQKSYDYAQGPVSTFSVANAIFGQESGWNPNIGKSINGAQGIAQIIPSTFRRFANPTESIDNPADNARVGQRMVDFFMKKYNGDAARVAVAYFSGEGNVSPMGYATPWKEDKTDGNGKSVSGYVSDVMGRLYKNRSGYGAYEGQYTPNMPNMPTTDGLKPPPMQSTFSGMSSPVPFTTEEITQNPYLASDFVRRQVADLKTEAATLKAQLPGIEDNIRKGIEPDQQTLAGIMQFSRAFPEMLPGVEDKLGVISEASQHVWHTNGKDLTKWLADTDEMARTSPDIRTQQLANEAMKMSQAAMKMQKDDPWLYGVRSGAFAAAPIGWQDATNPAAFGAQNTAQVIATGMDQRRRAGNALVERIGQGDAIELAYPKKDLKALSDTLDNADAGTVAQVLGAIQGNIKSPAELARIMGDRDVVRSIFGLAGSNDVGKALSANKFLEYAHEQSPYVFHGQFGEKAVNSVERFMRTARYSTPDEAVNEQIKARDINHESPIYKTNRNIAIKDMNSVDDRKVMKVLGLEKMPTENAVQWMFKTNKGMMPEIAAGQDDLEHGNMAAVTQLYKERYISAFADGATKEGAQDVAAKYVKDTFARSQWANGRLMWNSPEVVYKDPQQLMQFTNELNKAVYGLVAKQGILLDNQRIMPGAELGETMVKAGGIALLSDKKTADARISLQSPSYMIQVRDVDGKLHLLLNDDKTPYRFQMKGPLLPAPQGQ